MPGHRQPLASPDGEVFSPRCRKDVLCGWHMVLYARPLFRKKYGGKNEMRIIG